MIIEINIGLLRTPKGWCKSIFHNENNIINEELRILEKHLNFRNLNK